MVGSLGLSLGLTMGLKVNLSISWVLIDQTGSYITRIIEIGHLGDNKICRTVSREKRNKCKP